jgi:hypothetical protein
MAAELPISPPDGVMPLTGVAEVSAEMKVVETGTLSEISFPRRTLAALLALLLAFQLAACGTILYPERHGQRSGRVDPAVLLWVDFHTGAVYLPGKGRSVSVVPLPAGEPTHAAIERIVREHTGVAVELSDPALETHAVAPGRGIEAALRALQTPLRANSQPTPPPAG